MKRFKGALVALLFVIAAIMPISTVSTPAHAVSPYDSAYKVTDALILTDTITPPNTPRCPSIDISTSYMGILHTPHYWLGGGDSGFMSRFAHAMSSGGAWTVSRTVEWATNNSSVDFGFSAQANMPLEWHGDRVVAPTDEFVHIAYGKRDPSSACEPLVGAVIGEGAPLEISWTYSTSFTIFNFLTYNYDANYPAGYAGEQIREVWTLSAPTYVAMGDSFSSGEGNPSFAIGTDSPGVNMCHRSHWAYPHLLAHDPTLGLGPVDFVACSGATTSDVLYGGSGTGNWNEGPQIDALSEDTEIVTITVGGNDVGFRGYVETCVFWICGPGTSGFNAIMSNINSTSFLDDLKNVYGSILESAPKATVYVIGYPHIFDPGGGSFGCDIIDSSGATLVIDGLNATIGLAVAQVRSQSIDHSNRLHFVSATASGSPFEGKHLCTDDGDGPSFYPLMTYVVYSLHPNVNGQTNYYQLMKEVMQ